MVNEWKSGVKFKGNQILFKLEGGGGGFLLSTFELEDFYCSSSLQMFNNYI